MINEDSMLFPKQIKIDDYEPPSENNLIRIMETSNLLLGNGGKSSVTSIIMGKALHFMQEQGIFRIQGKKMLELGSGAGFLGIYMGCLGAHVILTDLPPIKEMAQKNINLNKQIIKGEAQFAVLNWRTVQKYKVFNKQKQGEIEMQKEEGVSTSSSDLNLIKGIEQIDYLVVCEGGDIDDFIQQLNFIGKQGMIIGFQEREHNYGPDFLNSHELQKYLLQNNYEYEKLEDYHPDYIDQRIQMYKIWK